MAVESPSQPVPISHVATRSASRRQQRWFSNTVAYVSMTVLALVFIFPWFWTLSTSLKDPSELFIFPPLWLPATPIFDNYLEVFRQVPFGLWYFNSLVVVILSTVGVLLTATLVSYSFARFRWPGRDVVF